MYIFRKMLCLCLLVVFVTLMSGCHFTQVRNEVQYLAELPAVEQIDLNVELRLTDEFRTAQLVHREQGSAIITPLGNPLKQNAEMTVRKAFKGVVVNETGGNGPVSGSNIQAVLIPEVATVKCDRPLTIFSTQTTTMHLVWTMKKPDGALLWTSTIEAEGKGPMGSLSKNSGQKQIRNLLQDASEKSLDKFKSSTIIRQYAESFKSDNLVRQ